MPKEIRKETTVRASLANVWQAWTTKDGIQSFFAPRANVEVRIGGPYEIFFHPTDERMSSKGMRVLSYLPMEMLSFEWNAPPQFPNVRENPIWVVVRMEETAPGTVRVRLAHLGWKEGSEWDEAFAYFDRAWGSVLDNLRSHFEKGGR